MSRRDWRRRIEDILEAVAEIQSFTAGMSLAQFSADAKTLRAVTAAFAIIGEAARHLPEEIVAAYPQVPWRVMSDMRNKLVHDYFSVEPQILWDTIQHDLPPLVRELQALVGEP